MSSSEESIHSFVNVYFSEGLHPHTFVAHPTLNFIHLSHCTGVVDEREFLMLYKLVAKGEIKGIGKKTLFGSSKKVPLVNSDSNSFLLLLATAIS